MQYPDGSREIDELHVPVGQPVKLTWRAEDVIHSFSIPAFRVRHDVVPAITTVCGSRPQSRAAIIFSAPNTAATSTPKWLAGWTYWMIAEYANWAGGGSRRHRLPSRDNKLFEQNGCSTCHLLDQQGRCPILRGVYNKPVQLDDGRTVIADDAYIRESILDPNAKIVSGFQPNIMPNFKGQLRKRT